MNGEPSGEAMPARARPGPVGHDAEAYFLAAYDLLGSRGYEGLSVHALCEQLGVTKGSFYNRFASLQTFVAAFAERWQAWVTGLIDAYLKEPDVRRRLELIVNTHIVALNGAEPVIRAWARSSPTIAEAVRAVDRYGAEATARTWGEVLGDPETALVLGALSQAIGVGLQQRVGQIDPGRYVRIEVECVRRILGVEAELVWADYGLAIRIQPWAHAILNAPQLEVGHLPNKLDEFAFGSVPGRSKGPRHDQKRLQRARSLTISDYLAAGRKILAASGSEGITIQSLCDELRITKGSFVHHFANMDEFVESMARDWEHRSEEWLGHCGTLADPIARLELLHQPMIQPADPAEASWRAWGWTNPVVAESLTKTDQDWQELLSETLIALNFPIETASLLAEAGVGLAIGLHHLQLPVQHDFVVLIVLAWLRRMLNLHGEYSDAPGPHLNIKPVGGSTAADPQLSKPRPPGGWLPIVSIAEGSAARTGDSG